jgi:outer membrane protein TolC
MRKSQMQTGSRKSLFPHSMLLCSAAGVLFLSACAPDLGPKPEIQAPAAFATQRTFSSEAGTWPEDAWWQVYGDPELNRLIDEALQGSPGIKIAEARLRQAKAAAQQAGAALVPDVSFDGSALVSKQSLNQGFPSQIHPITLRGKRSPTEADASGSRIRLQIV